MFGEEFGSVIGSGTCPRCGSVSRLRGLQRANTNIIVCHVTCNKCHYVQLSGFTSIQALAHEAVKDKLEKIRDQTDNPIVKLKIEHQLEMLEKKKKFEDLGL